MMWLFSLLGVGGALGVAAFFFPSLAISMATKVLDAVLTGISWFFSKVLEGATYISASPAAVLCLGVCIVASAYLGPNVFHNSVTQVVYAEPEPTKQRTYRARPKPRETDPVSSAWSDFACNVLASC